MTDTKQTAAQPLDLDKLEALAKAANIEKVWPFAENAFRKGLTPEVALALIAQARAARPVSLVAALVAVEELSKGAEIGKSEEWVNERASVILAALAQPAGAADTTASASIDTPEFRKLLADTVLGAPFHLPSLEKLITHLDSRAAQPVQTGVAVDAESFAEWLTREMPAGTVIGDPAWWARRISARATLAPVAAQQAAAVAAPKVNDVLHALDGLQALIHENSFKNDGGFAVRNCLGSFGLIRAALRPAANPPSDDEIERAALKHVATGWKQLLAVSNVDPDYRNGEQFKRLKAFALDLFATAGAATTSEDARDALRAIASAAKWWRQNQDSPKSALYHFERAAEVAESAMRATQQEGGK